MFEFNSDGNVVSFMHTKFNGDEVQMTVTYDADKRITGVSGKGTEDFLILFEYGTHGQYIPMEEIFYTIAESQVVSNMLWMPRFIKNLTRMTLTDAKDSSMNMTFVYTVDSGAGSLQLTAGSGTVIEEYQKLTFEDGFVKTVAYSDSYTGDTAVTYTVNPETGHVITRTVTDAWGDMTTEYNADAINSMRSLDDGYGIFYFSYNDNLDLVEVSDVVADDETVENTWSYEYDEQGNWTSMTSTYDSPVERTITYW
jgi:YD repeat-containing protein